MVVTMPEGTKRSARERLLDATEEMLREVGMAGTGIKEVVSRSGAPIGSLYHYFPDGKTQLVSESLRIHAEKSRRLLAHFFDGKQSAAAAVGLLFNTAADAFERAGAYKGCAIGAVALDLMPRDETLREICRSTFDDWAAMIAPQLPFSSERARRASAMTIVAALEGAFVLAKAAQSGDPFRDVGEGLVAAMPSRRGRRP
jgi:AcrR family transcriptional regulator